MTMSAENLINLTIDGKPVSVPAGTTILNAAKQVGISIPIFCYHGELQPIGACRMCLVEVEKMPKLQISCATTVAEGMVVWTRSEKALKGQKGILEFLLINHPLDCPVCDKGGECELQDNTFAHGPSESRFVEFKRRYFKRNLNQVIRLDMNRCIMCRRCVRTCSDIHGQGILGVVERGFRSEIDMMPGAENKCTFCGDCIEACPVGALTSIPFRFKARVWDLTKTNTVCTYCADGCRMTLETREQEILRARDRLTPGEYLSTEHLCAKGHFGFDVFNSDKRLTSPLIRKDEKLVPVTWDEAIQTAANGFKKIISDKGGQAIGILGSQRTTNEEGHLLKRLATDIIQTPYIDHLMTSEGALLNESFKRLSAHPASLEDVEVAQAIVVIGTNLEDSNPFTRLKVIRNQYREIGKVITIHSSDSGLRGYIQHEIKPEYGKEPVIIDLLSTALNGSSTDESIQAAAKTLASAERRVILFGRETISHPLRDSYVQAIENLVAELNKLGNGITKVLWLPEYNNSRGAYDTGLVPSENVYGWGQMVDTLNSGTMQGLYIVGENPLERVTTGKSEVKTALEKVPFLVVQDMFLTETAAMADVVFPACSFAEKDGTFISGEGLAQRITAAFQPKGASKPDWQILMLLANALGADWNYSDPKDISLEMKNTIPAFSSVDYGQLGRDGLRLSYQAPEQPEAKTADLSGLKALPALSDFEFHLVTENMLYHSGSMTRAASVLNQLCNTGHATLSLKDAQRLGISENQTVTLSGKTGTLTLPVKLAKYQAPGTVMVPVNFTDTPVGSLFPKGTTHRVVTLKPGEMGK